MRRVSFYAVLALLLCAFVSPRRSRADSITYDLNNFVFQDGSTLTGSFTVDSLQGGGIPSDIFSSHSGNTYSGIFEASSNSVQFQGVMGTGIFPFVDVAFSGSLLNGVPLTLAIHIGFAEDTFELRAQGILAHVQCFRRFLDADA
jgi:hypothetical protein